MTSDDSSFKMMDCGKMLGSLLEKENKNKGQRSGFQADNVCGESYSSKNNNLSIIHLGHSVYNNTGEPAGG